MGKFFSALHIKSDSKDQFVNMFTQLMKKDGYVPCSEDEAALSYAAAFSEGGWVTLSNGDDRVDGLSKLSERLAKELKLASFTVEAVDSDFAILGLHAPGGRKSRIVVGDGEGYGVEKAPFSADEWKPLLQNGDIEKFLAVIGQDSTFVEDNLAEIGGLLGISGFAMTADYDEISGNEGAFELSFKKAAEKKLTLNAAFKQVFGEALEPLGFKLIKSKYLYFVRVAGDEIVHIISITQRKNNIGGRKIFKIRCGVATVYRKKLDFNITPDDFLLQHISEIYSRLHPSDLNMEYRASIMTFKYDTPIPHFLKNNTVEFTTDENEMLDSLKNALAATKQVFLPVVNKVTSLIDCEKYFYALGQHSAPVLDFEGEGLFLIKLFSSAEDFFQFKESEAVNGMRVEELLCDRVGGDFARELKDFEDKKEARKKYWIEMFNAPELRADGSAELERRKRLNTEILKEVGLNL